MSDVNSNPVDWKAGDDVYYGESVIGKFASKDPEQADVAIVSLNEEFRCRWNAVYAPLELDCIFKYNAAELAREKCKIALDQLFASFTKDEVISTLVDSGICLEDLAEKAKEISDGFGQRESIA